MLPRTLHQPRPDSKTGHPTDLLGFVEGERALDIVMSEHKGLISLSYCRTLYVVLVTPSDGTVNYTVRPRL